MLAQSLQSCLTLSDNMDYRLPGSSVHGIHQARILEWVAAGVQPQQEPGGTLRMNGIGERRHMRPALIGPSLRGREKERERERVTRWGVQQGLAESGNPLFFTVAFIP